MSAVRTPAFKSVADRSSLDLLSRRFLFCSAVLILASSWLEKNCIRAYKCRNAECYKQ